MSRAMQAILPGLIYRTDFDLSYGGGVRACAYLVVHTTGNVLVGCCETILNHVDFIREKGGLKFVLLTHAHEASSITDDVRNEFSAHVVCHQDEVAAVRKHCCVDVGFRGELIILNYILSIESPGHSRGSTCYRLLNTDCNILFTGDTFYLANGAWVVTFEEDLRKTLVRSLKKLKELDIDVALPGIIVGEDAPVVPLERRWAALVQAAVDRVEAGARH